MRGPTSPRALLDLPVAVRWALLGDLLFFEFAGARGIAAAAARNGDQPAADALRTLDTWIEALPSHLAAGGEDGQQ